MLFLITGASGSGKSACTPGLKSQNPSYAWYEFDGSGAPPDADSAWRQQRTETWLRTAIEHQQAGVDTAITGGAILGEVLACPSAPAINGIELCLLDCYDVVRIDRIRARGPQYDTMDTLAWAAWQRMHAVDPQWRPDVIRARSAPGMHWERWENWTRGDPRWDHTWRLDTTDLTVAEVVDRISRWMSECRLTQHHRR